VIAAWLVIGALLAPAQDASGATAESVAQAAEEDTATSSVLDLSPDAWPHAEAGTWDAWDPDVAPEGDLFAGMQEAAIHYHRGDLPASLAALYELLEARPDYPPALYQAGAIYFRLRRYGDAAYAFERYLAVAPSRVADTRALGHALYTLGRYEAAEAHYRRVLEAGGEHPEALRGLALAEWRLGRPDAALAGLARLLELDPQHDEAQLWRARILFDEERTAEALEAAEAARERDPYEPQAWFMLSQLYFEAGREEAAHEARERFLQLDLVEQETRVIESQLLYAPHQPGLRARLIELRAGIGDLPAVREAFAEWMQIDPRGTLVRMHAIDVLVVLDDREGADFAAASLKAIAEDDVDAWAKLARYYATTRQRNLQVEAERRLAELRAK
jgi:tetratricopeptide (TPR) repeat protein